MREVQKKAEEDQPITNITASAMLAAELTLIASVLVAVIMVRLIHPVLMIIMIAKVLIIAVMPGPSCPDLERNRTMT